MMNNDDFPVLGEDFPVFDDDLFGCIDEKLFELDDDILKLMYDRDHELDKLSQDPGLLDLLNTNFSEQEADPSREDSLHISLPLHVPKRDIEVVLPVSVPPSVPKRDIEVVLPVSVPSRENENIYKNRYKILYTSDINKDIELVLHGNLKKIKTVDKSNGEIFDIYEFSNGMSCEFPVKLS